MAPQKSVVFNNGCLYETIQTGNSLEKGLCLVLLCIAMFSITPYLKPVFDGGSIIFSSKNTHVSTPKQTRISFLYWKLFQLYLELRSVSLPIYQRAAPGPPLWSGTEATCGTTTHPRVGAKLASGGRCNELVFPMTLKSN